MSHYKMVNSIHITDKKHVEKKSYYLFLYNVVPNGLWATKCIGGIRIST